MTNKKLIILVIAVLLTAVIAIGVGMKNEQTVNNVQNTTESTDVKSIDKVDTKVAEPIKGTEPVVKPVEPTKPVEEVKPTEPKETISAARRATLNKRAIIDEKVRNNERLTREDLIEQQKFASEATSNWDGDTDHLYEGVTFGN